MALYTDRICPNDDELGSSTMPLKTLGPARATNNSQNYEVQNGPIGPSVLLTTVAGAKATTDREQYEMLNVPVDEKDNVYEDPEDPKELKEKVNDGDNTDIQNITCEQIAPTSPTYSRRVILLIGFIFLLVVAGLSLGFSAWSLMSAYRIGEHVNDLDTGGITVGTFTTKSESMIVLLALCGYSDGQPDVRDCDATPPYLPDTVTETTDQLLALRQAMSRNRVQAYLIPEVDAHHMEYIADHDRRLTYTSGFSGSAGLAVVTATAALLYTDGRYFLQADKELDCNWQLVKYEGDPNFSVGAREWLAENLMSGDNVGFDPTLMSVSDYEGYGNTFTNLGVKRLNLLPVALNLVDQIWDTQPAYPNTTLLILDAMKYTGETWQEKIWEFPGEESIRGKLEAEGADAIVITKLDEIAWLFNMRGQDIPYNPMFVAYAIIDTSSIRLYLYDRVNRLTDEVRTHLNIGNSTCATDETLSAECVAVLPYERFLTDLGNLRANKIWISDESSFAVYDRVPQNMRLIKASPLLMMKAVKSLKEREGMRNAHLKDSVVLCELGAWMQETLDSLEDPMVGDIDILNETTVIEKAIELRSMQDLYQDESFEAISAFGANGAVIHYSSTNETNQAISKDGIFLFDSGSQYLDGTTDITRSYHFGTPTRLMKEAYTRILMGQIDVAQSVWRTGVYGSELDAIARSPLWQAGLDYRHGTGHGIGHFLAVHEGPSRLRIGYAPWHEPYEIGMFTSDEPGYYEDGEFGIRIEDIVEVVEAETMYKFNNWTYMTFDMISMVPNEPNLIDFSLMSAKQIDHYNAYNKRIRDIVGPRLSAKARKWMETKTEPVEYTFKLGGSESASGTSQITVAVLGMILCLFGSIVMK